MKLTVAVQAGTCISPFIRLGILNLSHSVTPGPDDIGSQLAFCQIQSGQNTIRPATVRIHSEASLSSKQSQLAGGPPPDGLPAVTRGLESKTRLVD